MPKHGTASISGAFIEFECAVLRNLPRDLDPEVMDNHTNNGEALSRILREALCPKSVEVERSEKSKADENKNLFENVDPIFRPSAELYFALFGKVPDFSGLTVPRMLENENEYLVIVVDKELCASKQALFQARKKLFPTWKYTNENLDTAIPAKDDQRKVASGSYVFIIRDSETPDSDLMNLSANQIAEMKLQVTTDTEYALFSAMFYWKHEHHPDRSTWTINAGSRDRDGDVPRGDWNGNKSRVRWCGVADHYPYLGSRRVIRTP